LHKPRNVIVTVRDFGLPTRCKWGLLGCYAALNCSCRRFLWRLLAPWRWDC